MNARHLAIFLGLAAFGGVAWAAVRGQARSAGEGVDIPDGDVAAPSVGDWGVVPDFGAWSDVVSAQGLSAYGLQQLKAFEGFSATPYPDHKGQSIGYGHLILPGESFESVSEEQASAILANDVAWAEQAVRSAVVVPLTANQFDALVCFCFNVGAGAFRGSTLVRKLNAGDVAGAAAEFPRWNRASGQVNSALVSRRRTEQSLFEA